MRSIYFFIFHALHATLFAVLTKFWPHDEQGHDTDHSGLVVSPKKVFDADFLFPSLQIRDQALQTTRINSICNFSTAKNRQVLGIPIQCKLLPDCPCLCDVCAGLGLQPKFWKKLSDIRPVNMQKQIALSQKNAITITDTDMKTLQSEQRRRWSAHMKQQREQDAREKTINREIKTKRSQANKQKRLDKLRKSEALKRKIAKEKCEGLPRCLVPTNIPDKHGLDPTVPKVLAHG